MNLNFQKKVQDKNLTKNVFFFRSRLSKLHFRQQYNLEKKDLWKLKLH